MRSNSSKVSMYGETREPSDTIFYDCVEDANEIENHAISVAMQPTPAPAPIDPGNEAKYIKKKSLLKINS